MFAIDFILEFSIWNTLKQFNPFNHNIITANPLDTISWVTSRTNVTFGLPLRFNCVQEEERIKSLLIGFLFIIPSSGYCWGILENKEDIEFEVKQWFYHDNLNPLESSNSTGWILVILERNKSFENKIFAI